MIERAASALECRIVPYENELQPSFLSTLVLFRSVRRRDAKVPDVAEL